MSNNLLTQQAVHAAASSSSAPSGLRAARRSSINNSNPILKPKGQQPPVPMFNADALLSPADKKLKEFQSELIATNAQQRQRQLEDDAIVEGRMRQVHDKEARIEAAKHGERAADFGTFIPHATFEKPKYLLDKGKSRKGGGEREGEEGGGGGVDRDLLMMDDDDDEGDVGPTVAALGSNAYSDLADLREQQRHDKLEAKRKAEAEEAAAKEKERKRRGALANLALKRQQNPELYANAEKTALERKKYDEEQGAVEQGETKPAAGGGGSAVPHPPSTPPPAGSRSQEREVL